MARPSWSQRRRAAEHVGLKLPSCVPAGAGCCTLLQAVPSAPRGCSALAPWCWVSRAIHLPLSFLPQQQQQNSSNALPSRAVCLKGVRGTAAAGSLQGGREGTTLCLMLSCCVFLQEKLCLPSSACVYVCLSAELPGAVSL